jgi:molybdate transport system regulatory protein
VTFGPRTKLGDGRARLLELIDELGSIRQAVARLGMSYRAAWGYLGELEAAAGIRIIDRRPGRGERAGARLTPDGRALIARYRKFRRALEAIAVRRFAAAFSGAGRPADPPAPAGARAAGPASPRRRR